MSKRRTAGPRPIEVRIKISQAHKKRARTFALSESGEKLRRASLKTLQKALASAGLKILEVGKIPQATCGVIGIPLKVRCATCGHSYTTSGNRVQQGRGCPKCAIARRSMSQQEATKRFRDFGLELLGSYSNKRSRVEVKCLKCGNEYITTYKRLSWDGHKCSECSPTHKTFGASEAEVRRTIEKITGWKFPRARPDWLRGRSRSPMELDGYNKRHQIAFEYQGIQHYEPIFGERSFEVTKRNDERKRVLAHYHGVSLIRVPYWKRDIEGFIRSKLQKFKGQE